MIKQIMNGFSKFFKKERIIILVAFLILALALYYYNGSKNTIIDKFSNPNYPMSSSMPQSEMTQYNTQEPQIQLPQIQLPEVKLPEVKLPEISQTQMPTMNVATPSDLLPIDNNSQWASLNPTQNQSTVMTPDLLIAGYHIGTDTIGQTLRNPNLQLRSDPIIQKTDVGPWNLSTIEPDFGRVPLEIGDSR